MYQPQQRERGREGGRGVPTRSLQVGSVRGKERGERERKGNRKRGEREKEKPSIDEVERK